MKGRLLRWNVIVRTRRTRKVLIRSQGGSPEILTLVAAMTP